MKERGQLRNDEEKRDIICSDGTRRFIERVIEIETGYHNGELSERLLRYANLMPYKPVIDDIVKEKGVKYVDQHSLGSLSSEEIEDAIDLHIEYLETDEVFLSRYYVWALCVPTVLYIYQQMLHAFIDNCRIYKDLRSFQDTFMGISYEHFCKVLQRHIKYLLAGKFGSRKGALTYILKTRLSTDVMEDFIDLEFGPFGGFLTKQERKHEKAKEAFYWERGHEPSMEELSEYMGERLKTVIERDRRIMSKKYPVFFDALNSKGIEIYDKCRFDGKPQEGLIHYEFWADKDICRIVKNNLSGELLNIVMYRYGFNEKGETFSVKQIAEKMNTDVDHVKCCIREAHNILKPHLKDYAVHTL